MRSNGLVKACNKEVWEAAANGTIHRLGPCSRRGGLGRLKVRYMEVWEETGERKFKHREIAKGGPEYISLVAEV